MCDKIMNEKNVKIEEIPILEKNGDQLVVKKKDIDSIIGKATHLLVRQLNKVVNIWIQKSKDEMIEARKVYVELFVIDLEMQQVIFYDYGDQRTKLKEIPLSNSADIIGGMLPTFKTFFKEGFGEDVIRLDVDLEKSDLYMIVKKQASDISGRGLLPEGRELGQFLFVIRVPNSMCDENVHDYLKKVVDTFFIAFENEIEEYRKTHKVQIFNEAKKFLRELAIENECKGKKGT
jgi:hypothetical protein